jgi:hypothetical protein
LTVAGKLTVAVVSAVDRIDVLANDDHRSEVDQRDASREQRQSFRSHLRDVPIFKVTVSMVTSERSINFSVSAMQLLSSIIPSVSYDI